MNRALVLRAAAASALLGVVAGSTVGWGGMQPMGLLAGGVVGYSAVRASDAIFDGALAGVLGGVLALIVVVPVAYVRYVLQTGDAATGGELAAHAAVSGTLFVPTAYAVGAIVAAVAVFYLRPRITRAVGRRSAP